MTDKCNPDDPKRCQGMTRNGQCEYLSVKGANFCKYHQGDRKGGRKHEQAKIERYLIDDQKLRQSYTRQQNDRDYLSLKEEINLLTAFMERRYNTIKTDADVIMSTGQIAQLNKQLAAMKINLLKIQAQLGLVLGKDELRSLAREMASILDQELEGIEDKDTRMDVICKRLFEAVEGAGKSVEELNE